MKIKVKRSLLTALFLTLAAALLITGCTGNGETAGGEAEGENKDKTVLEEGSIRYAELDEKSAESVEYFIDEYGLYEYKAPDEAMQMKLVRFSYENGELADHEICAIDFSEMENLREGTIALCMAGEDKYRVTVSPDKRAEDGAGGKQVYTDIELPSYIGEKESGRADSTVKNFDEEKIEIDKQYRLYEVNVYEAGSAAAGEGETALKDDEVRPAATRGIYVVFSL